tara:strand:- start:250 stop:1380 length:1131 start_codon:yes stop_codon:yes gene_type:complete
MNNRLKMVLLLGLSALATSGLWARDLSKLDLLGSELATIAEQGDMVGLQVAVRGSEGLLFSHAYGEVAADSPRPVDEETLFLIASCSKPFASACLLSLINDAEVEIDLSDEIGRWIPAFESIEVKGDGPATRAPTVEELMAHRAGIYSQKVGMNRRQTQWIRDFRNSLEVAVDGILESPLIAQPGELYAYSGAGYCVLGRVAEAAAGESFEALLQERICKPLGLSRTTYFPAGDYPDREIATGVPRATSPHRLGEEHQLPLIGGSLYTTAEEMTLFGVSILNGWKGDGSRLEIPEGLIKELGKVRSTKTNYSLGWKVVKRNGAVVRLSHSGSLNSHRAWLAVDLEKGVSVAACWTLSGSDRQAPVTEVLQQYLIGD